MLRSAGCALCRAKNNKNGATRERHDQTPTVTTISLNIFFVMHKSYEISLNTNDFPHLVKKQFVAASTISYTLCERVTCILLGSLETRRKCVGASKQQFLSTFALHRARIYTVLWFIRRKILPAISIIIKTL